MSWHLSCWIESPSHPAPFGHTSGRPAKRPTIQRHSHLLFPLLHGRVAVLAFHLAHNFTFASAVVFPLPAARRPSPFPFFPSLAIAISASWNLPFVTHDTHGHGHTDTGRLKPKLEQKQGQKQKAALRMHRHFHFHAWAHRSESIIHHHRLSKRGALSTRQPPKPPIPPNLLPRHTFIVMISAVCNGHTWRTPATTSRTNRRSGRRSGRSGRQAKDKGRTRRSAAAPFRVNFPLIFSAFPYAVIGRR